MFGKKLNILIDECQKPVGGKWSFDDENRKKIPRTVTLPRLFKASDQSKHIAPIKNLISKTFSTHPGCTDNVWMPLTRKAAIENLDYFLKIKFKDFGTYEDAILKRRYLFIS
jgi:deoxyribodipyrimidine photolyase-related protein